MKWIAKHFFGFLSVENFLWIVVLRTISTCSLALKCGIKSELIILYHLIGARQSCLTRWRPFQTCSGRQSNSATGMKLKVSFDVNDSMILMRYLSFRMRTRSRRRVNYRCRRCRCCCHCCYRCYCCRSHRCCCH